MKQKATNFQKMRELGYYQQAAVAAALLERMIPNYQLFHEVTEFGDAKLCRDILNMVWEWLFVRRVKINFERLAEELELATPDQAHFDVFGVFPAIDAATALDSMLNGISQQDAAEFINVAKISQATVARLIEWEAESEANIRSEAELKKYVREHELMQYEMDCLAELIDLVTPIQSFEKSDVQRLKAWVKEQGLTNLAMELNLESGSAVE